jgi:hypothetical protein
MTLQRESKMTKTLKTLTLSTALAVMFLSAGAFAGAPSPSRLIVKTNVTIIHKNSAWPYKAKVVVEVCAKARCIAV